MTDTAKRKGAGVLDATPHHHITSAPRNDPDAFEATHIHYHPFISTDWTPNGFKWLRRGMKAGEEVLVQQRSTVRTNGV